MCQQERSTLKDEISHQLGKENETFFLRVWKLKENFKKKKVQRRQYRLDVGLSYYHIYVCMYVFFWLPNLKFGL